MERTDEQRMHVPVLAEAVRANVARPGAGPRRMIDGTVGCGGHAGMILRDRPELELLGLDRDGDALAFAKSALAFAGNRVRLRQSVFSEMRMRAEEIGWESVDAVLLDLGVSSVQLDRGERGFSYRFPDAPLDMRMDRESGGESAAELVGRASEEELARIFREYGELREAGRLARRIVRERRLRPIVTCGDLARICDEELGGRGRGGGRKGPPAPTLPFQALRIAVNGELDELRAGLEAATELLAPGGRLLVISFHSLEDRIVKRFFREMAETCKCPPGLPVCRCGWTPKLAISTKRPIEADEREKAENSRSACAKLRVAERIGTKNGTGEEKRGNGDTRTRTEADGRRQGE